MKKQILTVLLTLGLLMPSGILAAAFPKNAQVDEHGPQLQAPQAPAKRGPFLPRARRNDRPSSFFRLAFLRDHQDELNISDEQLQQIEELTFQMEEIRIKQQSMAAENRLKMKKNLMEESRDYARIESLMNQNAENRNRVIVEGMKIRDRMESVLTQEQLDALRETAREELSQRRPLLRERLSHELPRLRERRIS